MDNFYGQAALLIGREMPRVSVSAVVHTKLASGARWVGGWSTSTLVWMVAAFLIAVASAAVVLAIFGVGERGTTIALRLTARWSFVLFWFAYTGSATARLFGSHLAGLARHGRDFGLAFASAQVVHVGLVLWLFYLAPGKNGGMVFFWVGILCTYLLALFSLPRLRDALGPRLWRIACTIAMEYIALVFFNDFIRLPVKENGLSNYPLSYLPFALMLVGGAGLRVVSFTRFAAHRRRTATIATSSMVMRGTAFQRQENGQIGPSNPMRDVSGMSQTRAARRFTR